MRCHRSVKKSLKKEHEDWTRKRIDKVARAICVKRTGMTFQHSEMITSPTPQFSVSESGAVKSAQVFFNSPFTIIEKEKLKEALPDYVPKDPNSVIIVGTAVSESRSSNGRIYVEKELKKATSSLKGCKCQVDHSESIRDTFGVITETWWEKETKATDFVAELEGDDPVTAKVVKGYVENVSIAASAERMECNICGEEMTWLHEHQIGEEYDGVLCGVIPMGINYRHLGFVLHGGVKGAGAEYVPASVGEAFENLLTAWEYDQQAPRPNLGSKKSMGNEEDMAKVLQEKERLRLELEDARKEKVALEGRVKETAKLEEEVKKMRETNTKRVVDRIVEVELKLGRYSEKEAIDKKTALLKENEDSLSARLSVLEEWLKKAYLIAGTTDGTQGQAKSKVMGFDEKTKSNYGNKQAFYEKEAKIEKIGMLFFGTRPSRSAVRTCQEYNVRVGKWKNSFSELATGRIERL